MAIKKKDITKEILFVEEHFSLAEKQKIRDFFDNEFYFFINLEWR